MVCHPLVPNYDLCSIGGLLPIGQSRIGQSWRVFESKPNNFHSRKCIWKCYPVCAGFNDLMQQPYCRQLAIKITHVPQGYTFCDSSWKSRCDSPRKSSFSSHSPEYVPCIIGICPDSKVHGANMGLTWVLSATDGPIHQGVYQKKRIVINLSPHLYFQIHCPVHWNFFDRTVWPKYTNIPIYDDRVRMKHVCFPSSEIPFNI